MRWVGGGGRGGPIARRSDADDSWERTFRWVLRLPPTEPMTPPENSPTEPATAASALSEPLLDSEAAATLLSVRRSWIYEAVRDGRLPHVKVGRHIRFLRADLENWVFAQRRGRLLYASASSVAFAAAGGEHESVEPVDESLAGEAVDRVGDGDPVAELADQLAERPDRGIFGDTRPDGSEPISKKV